MRRFKLCFLLSLAVATITHAAPTSDAFNGARALEYTRQFVSIGPRWVGSPGHAKAEAFLKKQFAKDNLEEDTFTMNTPAGPAGDAQLHRPLSRQKRRRDRAGVALRDELSAAQHQLRRRERRRFVPPAC